jgi:hypothetical protein
MIFGHVQFDGGSCIGAITCAECCYLLQGLLKDLSLDLDATLALKVF